MDPNKIQQLIEQNRINNGQRVADMAANIKPVDYAQDREVMANNDAKNKAFQELFDHDRQLAVHADPNSPTYIPDPYMREVARANQYQATSGQILDINKVIDARKSYLDAQQQNAYKNAQLALQGGQMDQSALQNEFSNAFQTQQYNQAQNKEAGRTNALTQLLNGILGGGSSEGTNPDILAATTIPGGNTGNPANKEQMVRGLLASTIAQHPELAGEATSIVNTLMPPKDSYDFSAENIAAGVAGLPKTPQTNAIAQKYILDKQQKDKLQYVQDKGFLNTGLGGGDYVVDLNTGKKSKVNSSNSGGGVIDWLKGFLGLGGQSAPQDQGLHNIFGRS